MNVQLETEEINTVLRPIFIDVNEKTLFSRPI